MDAYSWFRRSLSKLKKASSTTTPNEKANDEELQNSYGINDQLIQLIKSFSIETFKNFSLPDEGGGDDGDSGTVRKDLSDWQETHAKLILSRVEELAQLRFKLCPRYLKERQFWRIYFSLVRSCVSKYELRAVQLAKLKQMSMEGETVSNNSSYEVEMSEAKFTTPVESECPTAQKFIAATSNLEMSRKETQRNEMNQSL